MGYKIKTIRERNKMSQLELARKSGVSRTTIWGLENGGKNVTTTKTLEKIACALGVTIDDILAADTCST